MAAMQTRKLDVHDDAACSRAYDVLVAAKSLGRPWNRPPSLAESLVEWRHEDPSERMEMWEAVDEDGLVVGIATLWITLDDNVTKLWCEVDTAPEHRRRGAGAALVERIVSRAREEGRTELLGDLLVPPGEPEHPYLLFAEAQGFRRTNTEIMRHLELPVAGELLERLETSARPRWEGDYRLETHLDGVPEPLQESLCAVMNLLGVDAPTGDVDFEPESLTPERYREYLQVFRDQGRERLTTVAVHEASGDVVAYSDLVLPAAPNPLVWQWGTFVDRDHRGHRLGTAVKVENLRRLQASHPERERVVTGNDETNSWMVDINLALGFEVKELCPAFRRMLD